MKKIYTLISCLVLAIMALGMNVNASTGSTIISVDKVIAGEESSVRVPVKIMNNEGLVGATITIEYDQALTLQSIDSGDAFSSLTMTKPGDLTEKKINIVWDGMEEDSSNGVIAVLNFSKPKKAGSYDVKISYEDGGIIDGNLQPVEVTMYNGSITVKESSEGEKDSCAVNGHKGGKATCSKKAVCSVCGKEYGEVDPTNHEGETELRNVKKATCTEDGNTGDTYCKSCNTKIKEGTVTKATGHKGGKATWSKKAVCSVCGKEYGEVDLKNHEGETELRNYKWEDCTKGLYSGDIYCKTCGTLLIKGTSFPPSKSHDWMEGEVIKAPTATKTGIMQYECLYCPVTKRVVLGVLKLKNGEHITDKSSGAVYKVTGKNTVEFVKATSKKTSRTIPSTVTLKGIKCQVTSIAAKAFKGDTKIKTVVIPTTIRKIGNEAFAGCKNLKSITIKTTYLSSKTVGAKAFKGINAKAKIKVPKKQKKAYQKLLKAKGIGKKVTIK